MSNIEFQTINWSLIEATEHTGETGTSFWRTLQLPGIRLRMVEYSKGYLADHWPTRICLGDQTDNLQFKKCLKRNPDILYGYNNYTHPLIIQKINVLKIPNQMYFIK